MDNVNFQCGNCGQLMAVGAALVGQQVRCPHCQQVVLAPAPASPAPAAVPEPASFAPANLPPGEQLEATRISVPSASELESIFASPESTSDALFDEPPRGLVEMPPEPLPPEPPPVLGPMETTLTYHPGTGGRAGVDAPTNPDPAAFGLGPVAPTTTEAAPTAVEEDALAQAIPRHQIRAPVDKGGWLIALLIVPLISYSILATIAVVYLRFFQQPASNQPHPLEMIPDLEGDNPGVRPAKKKVSINFHGRQESDLPAHLRASLNNPIRVGDVEVTPLAVECRTIDFLIASRKPEPSATPSLVLSLRFKNLSANTAFHPLDPFFERRWKEIKGESKAGMPFTYLTVGKARFYGGPISIDEWEERRERIRGQKLERELQPGETLETFICTSPDDPVKEAVAKTSQPLLWRVQVRRGLVQTPNRGELAASAVIGVEFTRDEIQKSREEH